MDTFIWKCRELYRIIGEVAPDSANYFALGPCAMEPIINLLCRYADFVTQPTLFNHVPTTNRLAENRRLEDFFATVSQRMEELRYRVRSSLLDSKDGIDPPGFNECLAAIRTRYSKISVGRHLSA